MFFEMINAMLLLTWYYCIKIGDEHFSASMFEINYAAIRYINLSYIFGQLCICVHKLSLYYFRVISQKFVQTSTCVNKLHLNCDIFWFLSCLKLSIISSFMFICTFMSKLTCTRLIIFFNIYWFNMTFR